jgi:hypothetical protein
VSVIPAPIVTGPDAVVVRPGVALITVKHSPMLPSLAAL